MSRVVTHGGLFSGVGGFSKGFERAGIKTIWECELDKNCRKLLAQQNPSARIHDDVKTFNPDDFECPTMLSFGSPCQDLSVAGNRAGLAGGRSGLFYEATRIISGFVGRGLELAVWENVVGAFSSRGGRDFACILREMAKCGAVDIAWRVLDAQWFGVAQRRRRVFLVADFREQRAAEILSLAESLCGHPAPSREQGQGIAPTISARTKGGGGLGTDFDLDGGLIARDVAHCLCAHAAKGGDPTTDNYVAHTLRAEGFDASEDGTGRGTPLVPIAFNLRGREDGAAPEMTDVASVRAASGGSSRSYIAFSSKDHGADAGLVSPTLRAMGHKSSHLNGGGQVAVAYRTTGNCGVFEQGDKSACLNTATDPNQNIVQIGVGVRRITPLECERLMGWPDNHTAGFSDSTRYKMCGNGVVANCAEYIGRKIAPFFV